MKRYFIQHPKISIYIIAVLISFFLLFLMQKKTNKKKLLQSKTNAHSIDTFIPKGFVLVPIEIENYKSLNSALGQYGVVDLYAPNKRNPLTYKRIVRGVQILRSPYQPYEFAVMIPEERAELILAVKGVFKVAIQNPKVDKMNFEISEKKIKKKKREIYVEF